MLYFCMSVVILVSLLAQWWWQLMPQNLWHFYCFTLSALSCFFLGYVAWAVWVALSCPVCIENIFAIHGYCKDNGLNAKKLSIQLGCEFPEEQFRIRLLFLFLWNGGENDRNKQQIHSVGNQSQGEGGIPLKSGSSHVWDLYHGIQAYLIYAHLLFIL